MTLKWEIPKFCQPRPAMLSPSTPSNRNRMSWFATESDQSPEEASAEIAQYLQDISEYRWCLLPSGKHMCFWYWHKGKSEKSWIFQSQQMGHTVSAYNQIAKQEKTRTKVLWTMFAGSNISLQEQLRKNVQVLVPRTPQTKRVEKENQPPVVEATISTRLDFVDESPALAVAQDSVIPDRQPPRLSEMEETISNFLQQPDFCCDRQILNMIATMTGKKLKHIHACVTFPSHSDELCFSNLSTLELHRRVIALERVGSGLLHLISSQELDVGDYSLSANDKEDLQFVQGGLREHGEGVSFWQMHQQPEAKNTKLSKICNWMAANRENAFKRMYLIVDIKTWGLPVISELLIAVHKSEKNKHQVWATLEQMLKIRQNIKNQESSYLLRYGGYLTMYCKRLQNLCSKIHQDTIPAYLQIADAPRRQGVFPIEGDFDSQTLANPEDLQQMVKRRLAEVCIDCFVVIVS